MKYLNSFVIVLSCLAHHILAGVPDINDQSFQDLNLSQNNNIRTQAQAQPVNWNGQLALVAKQVADKCVFKHSGSGYGENLFMISNSESDPDYGSLTSSAYNAWISEMSNYDFNNPEGSSLQQTGHFTQLVWKATTDIGCAWARCAGTGGLAYNHMFVCEYSPAGNVAGEYSQNVGPMLKSRS
ncbi:PR-1-like protein [Microthyrium microscopicum]|uniref:PR-1-like protein n=1 Tax=Microthyrium microscopicum TaxID=703497 RepID=A0A6A6TZU2_9PEZI|nr:PR-1-like protein [Microthyrium microscopicum]